MFLAMKVCLVRLHRIDGLICQTFPLSQKGVKSEFSPLYYNPPSKVLLRFCLLSPCRFLVADKTARLTPSSYVILLSASPGAVLDLFLSFSVRPFSSFTAFAAACRYCDYYYPSRDYYYYYYDFYPVLLDHRKRFVILPRHRSSSSPPPPAPNFTFVSLFFAARLFSATHSVHFYCRRPYGATYPMTVLTLISRAIFCG